VRKAKGGDSERRERGREETQMTLMKKGSRGGGVHREQLNAQQAAGQQGAGSREQGAGSRELGAGS